VFSAACSGGAGHPDAAPPSDATVVDANRIDADPSCVQWRRVSLTMQSAQPLEAAPAQMGRSYRIRATLATCPGDVVGSWQILPTLENDYLSFDVVGWRAGPDCEESAMETVTRDIAFQPPWQAQWSVITATQPWDDPLVIDVAAAPGGSCGDDPETACQRDCDCIHGGRCLSGEVGGAVVQRCVTPCNFDRECSGFVCGSSGGLDGVCDQSAQECDPDTRPCPEGFDCVLVGAAQGVASGVCEPTFELNAASRHTCTCDSECDAPLRCAIPFGAAEGRCEVVCQSPSPAWCSQAHVCEGNLASDFTVCDWVGD
jgi:hypothetical protein